VIAIVIAIATYRSCSRRSTLVFWDLSFLHFSCTLSNGRSIRKTSVHTPTHCGGAW